MTAQTSILVEVFVPLCNNEQIACGRGSAGEPESLKGNLYWGAAYGAERFLSRAPHHRVIRRMDSPFPSKPHVLRDVEIVRSPGPSEREVRLRLLAYSGRHIDRALEDFLSAASGRTEADIVVWAGHDRLMDVAVPPISAVKRGTKVIVLACSSEDYFGPVLKDIGAQPLLLTRTFMAPEAYLLEALSNTMAKHGTSSRAHLRKAAVSAYARYQRISHRAASTVFSTLR